MLKLLNRGAGRRKAVRISSMDRSFSGHQTRSGNPALKVRGGKGTFLSPIQVRRLVRELNGWLDTYAPSPDAPQRARSVFGRLN